MDFTLSCQLDWGHCISVFFTLSYMQIAILIKDGVVEEVISDELVEEIVIVDGDFSCCRPDAKWADAKETLKIVSYKKDF